MADQKGEERKGESDAEQLGTISRPRNQSRQPLTMDIGMGVRSCWRRATSDTSGICGGRLSCRRQRGEASTEAFGSARG
jgi:hypothetical protein